MATINISIHDTGSQQELSSPVSIMAPGSQAPSNGGGAPGDGGSEGNGSDNASLSGDPAADGMVDIGSPPAWLFKAIAAEKASAAITDSPVGNNTDGGSAPTE